MKKTLIFILLFGLYGCSFSDAQKDEPTVRPDDLEFAVDSLDDNPSTMDSIQVAPEKIAETQIHDEFEAPVEPTFEEFSRPELAKTQTFAQPETSVDEVVIVTDTVAADREVAMSDSMEEYRVQKGDTLMMVAFKIYGDYRKWKDLAGWNKDKLQAKISEGMILKYSVPSKKFGWLPNGLPYLVKTGDTLGKVSMDKYGTSRKWKSIYENNRPLIRNPNLIFAGFTLYYQPTRDLASQPR